MSDCKPKRGRKSTEDGDHEYNLDFCIDRSPSPIHASVYTDSDKHRKVLKLHYAMSGLSKKYNILGKLPEQTNKWEGERDLVYKLFKVRTCIFEVDTILWPGNELRYNLDKRFAPGRDYFEDNIFSFLDKAFQCLDIEDDVVWYRKPHNERVQGAADLRNQIILDMDTDSDLQTLDDMLKEYGKMEQAVKHFLVVFEGLLKLNYNDACEKIFEELFRHFVQIIGLTATNGETHSTLKFKYTDEDDETHEKSISSKPDLFLYNLAKPNNSRKRREENKTNVLAVVEVKKRVEKNKRVMDSGFSSVAKRRKQEEGTPSDEDEQMTDHDEQADSLHAEDNDCSLMQKDYINGTPRRLTAQEEQVTMAFLPQLLGEVAAVDSSPLLHLQRVPLLGFKKNHIAEKSVIGFGVVGFKVYVINFIGVTRSKDTPPLDFHLVPCFSGLGLDILISEPLSIIRKVDRNKLFKLLCALQSVDSVGPK